MEWDEYRIHDDKYVQYFKEVVRGKLPKSFLAMYDKIEGLHDCYLKNFYIANTGPGVRIYSKKRKSTLQMEFLTHDHWEDILIIYQNVTQLSLDLHPSDDVNKGSPTGFGSCLSDTFTVCDDGSMKHECHFFGGSSITVWFERISCEKIVNTYWR